MGLKQEKEKKDLDMNSIKKIIRIIKIKFIAFFIISFMILIFFWYYIVCFCGIYVNTQMHLINDSIISLVTSLFLPFGICLIPGLFGEFLYKFASLLENYLV